MRKQGERTGRLQVSDNGINLQKSLLSPSKRRHTTSRHSLLSQHVIFSSFSKMILTTVSNKRRLITVKGYVKKESETDSESWFKIAVLNGPHQKGEIFRKMMMNVCKKKQWHTSRRLKHNLKHSLSATWHEKRKVMQTTCCHLSSLHNAWEYPCCACRKLERKQTKRKEPSQKHCDDHFREWEKWSTWESEMITPFRNGKAGVLTLFLSSIIEKHGS